MGSIKNCLIPNNAEEQAYARRLLERRHRWWLNALAERRIRFRDHEIVPFFFRIHVQSLSGLRAYGEGEEVDAAPRQETVSTETRKQSGFGDLKGITRST